jgi:hypothetical protein
MPHHITSLPMTRKTTQFVAQSLVTHGTWRKQHHVLFQLLRQLANLRFR